MVSMWHVYNRLVSLLIKNGLAVTPLGQFAWDILCEEGTISALHRRGTAPEADEVIDAAGLLVFPGFIDPHIHSRDPGLTEKEDFAHSTRAAAAGGVTTVLEMPNVVPPLTNAQVFEERAQHLGGSAFVDFGLWGMALGKPNLRELPGLIAAGVVGIKLFWGYALHRSSRQLVYNLQDFPPEDLFLPPGTGEVFDIFTTISEAGGLLAAHCEERGILEAAERRLGRQVQTYEDVLTIRPDAAEPAAIALGAELARASGCRFHVVHVSSARGVEIVRAAQEDGIAVTAETCPQYLTLTDADYERIGPLMKIYPPVRSDEDRDALWEGIHDGTITSVGSDHAPHTAEQKGLGLAAAPAGAIGVETIVPLMFNEVAGGRMSAEELAWVLSEGTARLYGLYPRKGAIQPGSDADLTLIDPTVEWTIDNARLHSKHPLSPWHGSTVRGAPRMSLLRGRVIMRDGEPVGEPRGALVRPGVRAS